MKRLQRTDAGIDYAKLLAEHSGRLGGVAQYDERVRLQFGETVQASLAATAEAEHRLRGLRVEALFQSVVVSIGNVSLIKSEDCGEVFYGGSDVSVPDYRVITSGGRELLVEVKAVASPGPTANFSLSDKCAQRLLGYASRMSAPLRVAIFWENLGIWTLNRLDSFIRGKGGERKWRIDFLRAFMANEMSDLGDRLVATAVPLRFRVLIDTAKSDPMPPGAAGKFRLTLGGVQILSQDRVLTGHAARIAWKLLWYGTWQETHQEQRHDGTAVSAIDYVFAPREIDALPSVESGVHPIGFLSQIISRAYLDGASKTIHTTTSSEVVRPGVMGTFIPENFVRAMPELPLAILDIEPNLDSADSRELP